MIMGGRVSSPKNTCRLLMFFLFFVAVFCCFVDVLFSFASDGAKMFWGRGLYKYFLFWLAFGDVWRGICAPLIRICFMTTTHALKKQVIIN